MEGVTLKRDELIAAYSISNRLAVRVGALRGRGVRPTATVLESARAGSPLERLLLQPRLLAEAATLDTERVRAIAAESGREAGVTVEPLTVVRRDDAAILCLEEEVLAEQAWTGEEERKAGAVAPAARPAAPAARDALINPAEAQQLFDAHEVAKLKLEALTSAEADRRVAAIRRLQYAPLSAQEKPSHCLRVRPYPISPVRAEAVKALESLGFDRDTAEALQDVFEEDEHIRVAGLDRIDALLGGLNPAEKHVVAAILAEAFREFEAPEPQERILGVLAQAASTIAAHPDLAAALVGDCLHTLLVSGRRLERAAWDLFVALAAADNAPVVREIHRQLETMRDAHLRIYVLTLLAEVVRSDDGRASLARMMVQELVRTEADELDRQKLGHNLVALGGAAEPLLEAFRTGDARVRAALVSVLNLFVDVAPDAARYAGDVAELFLGCLRSGDRRLRLEVLRSRALTRAEVPAAVRARMAEQLVRDMGAYNHPAVRLQVDDLIEALSVVAAKPLLERIREAPRSEEADRAARILGRMVLDPERHEKMPKPVVQGLLRAARRHADDAATRGAYAWLLGAVAATPLVTPEEAEQTAEHLLTQLGKVPFHADMLDALGHLGASRNISLRQRLAIARLFSTLLSRPRDDDDEVMRERETMDGRLYEFGPRADFDAVALPVVVAAVRRMCLSPATSEAIRSRLTERLVAVWQEVASWQVMWSPRSTEELAATLAALGRSAELPLAQRLRIGRALMQQPGRLTVVEALGEMATTPATEPEIDEFLLDAGDVLLDTWSREDMSDEERRMMFGGLARIAARGSSNPRGRRAARFRKEVVALLLQSLREERLWTREPLLLIRDAPGVARALQQEIDARLGEVFALARIEARR